MKIFVKPFENVGYKTTTDFITSCFNLLLRVIIVLSFFNHFCFVTIFITESISYILNLTISVINCNSLSMSFFYT